MQLNNDNYYSKEANKAYMSVSQLKAFCKCEAAALAGYEQEKTTALLVGSYVDAWFEGTIDTFQAENPEIFKRDGSLKADYVKADQIIERVKKDRLFMEYMSGEKQIIKTGELFGVPFKIKMDSYHPGDKIVDLKVMRCIEPIMGKPFVEHWRYDWQGAVYQAIEGNNLPFYIAVATKEDEPNIELLQIPQYRLDECMQEMKPFIERAWKIKQGLIEPERCGVCPYCRSTKVLTEPIDYDLAGLSTNDLKAMKGEW